MVETRPTGSRGGGFIPSDGGDRRAGPVGRVAPPFRVPDSGKPGNRWPTARQLASLLVNGIFRLPERYRRGMFLDILI